MHKPYVVSADLSLVLKSWAKRNCYTLPSAEFFDQMRGEFSCFMRRIFPSFEIVPELEIRDGLRSLINQSGLHPVSLDKVYVECSSNLEITRGVNSENKDQGLFHRTGAPLLRNQLRRLSGLKEVVLVDDVVYSGSLLDRVIRCLSYYGVKVPLVCAGIGISEGLRRINAEREIWCVRAYEEVIDEICERDFFPGVPFGGRLLIGHHNVGVPYILPFGKPGAWASIPMGSEVPLSKKCIELTRRLFGEIERCSNRPVSCSNLDRIVPGIEPGPQRFVEALGQL